MSAVRAVRRVVSAAVALTLLALSVITLVEVIAAALDRPPWLIDEGIVRDDLAARPWDDPGVILLSSALLVVGLSLLAVSLARGRARSVALDSGDDGASLSVRRRSLERYLAGVAAAQPGVRTATATVKRGTLKVRAEATPLDAPLARERVQQAIAERLLSLGTQPALTTSVSVHPREQ